MEYPVRLPDHTFVVSTKHKLIPSVYASREIKGDSLSYSSPTHVAIRSLKHDKADAFAGFDDLMDVISLSHFEPYLKHDGKLKPIWVSTRDGHDGPRFPSTRQALIKLFQTKDIDYIIAVCNASGLSAYHFIERRIAPLSKELAGVILPHDHFGSHLNASRVTVDPELEMKNFKKAGEVLSDIWSSTEINGSAKWVDPKDSAKSFGNFTDRKVGSDWLNRHVRISKYCLEIAKCDDSTCCKALRTNVQTILKGQFLPTPIAMGSDVTLADPLLKSEKTKFLGFFLITRFTTPASNVLPLLY